MNENWLPIVGYEGRYEVSDQGRVRSVSRLVRRIERSGGWGTRRIPSRVIALHTWGAPYPGAVLVGADGSRNREMVHRLVAKAFVPNPESLDQVNHIDADTKNAAATNLEWCNQSHNVKHSYLICNRGSGPDHHFASLERDSGGHCKPKKDGGGWEVEEF